MLNNIYASQSETKTAFFNHFLNKDNIKEISSLISCNKKSKEEKIEAKIRRGHILSTFNISERTFQRYLKEINDKNIFDLFKLLNLQEEQDKIFNKAEELLNNANKPLSIDLFQMVKNEKNQTICSLPFNEITPLTLKDIEYNQKKYLSTNYLKNKFKHYLISLSETLNQEQINLVVSYLLKNILITKLGYNEMKLDKKGFYISFNETKNKKMFFASLNQTCDKIQLHYQIK